MQRESEREREREEEEERKRRKRGREYVSKTECVCLREKGANLLKVSFSLRAHLFKVSFEREGHLKRSARELNPYFEVLNP